MKLKKRLLEETASWLTAKLTNKKICFVISPDKSDELRLLTQSLDDCAPFSSIPKTQEQNCKVIIVSQLQHQLLMLLSV